MFVSPTRRDAIKTSAVLASGLWVGAAMAAESASAEEAQLTSADGHRFKAFLAQPKTAPKGGIVILHAVYGLAPSMKDVCARWAQAGYTAIAPALYDRTKPDTVHPYTREGVKAGSSSYAALTEAQIFQDVAACRERAGGAQKVAISGFCTGGSWAWRAASKMDFAAHVNFYGSHVATPDYIDLEPRSPTIIHYGDKDAVVPMTDVEKIRARHPSVELIVHPGAGHAFLNPDQESFHAEAAEHAWRRSIDFMDRQFAQKKG